jgi:hypothetical protein
MELDGLIMSQVITLSLREYALVALPAELARYLFVVL